MPGIERLFRFSARRPPPGSALRISLSGSVFIPLLILNLAAGAGPASGQPAGAWGTSPESDSTSVRFRNRGMPVWEGAVVWPWRVATFPVKLAGAGLGALIVYLDDNHIPYRIQRLLTPPDLPYGFTTNLHAGGLTGLAGGLTFYHNEFFGPDNRFRLGTQVSLNDARRASLGMRFREGRRIGLEAGAGYRLRRNARFFGLGSRSTDDDESFYTQELTWGGLSVRRKMGGGLDGAATVIYSLAGARDPRPESTPPLSEVFAGDLPAGFKTRSDGYSIGVELHHEDELEYGRPESGGLRRLRASWFRETETDPVSFWTYRAEFQQFLPLWFSRRALAVRGVVSWIDPPGDGVIPFQRLMTNDDPDQLRGYRDFRFHDRGLALLSVEYRWPLWAARHENGPGADAYLLADFGQVFGEFDQIALRDLADSYGIGLRLIGGKGFLARLEYARSSEDSVVRLAASQNFQFSRNGLFHGRNPVPER